jgi:hypothetical protein
MNGGTGGSARSALHPLVPCSLLPLLLPLLLLLQSSATLAEDCNSKSNRMHGKGGTGGNGWIRSFHEQFARLRACRQWLNAGTSPSSPDYLEPDTRQPETHL